MTLYQMTFNDRLRRQQLLRQYVLEMNIRRIQETIAHGGNPAKDPVVSQIYFALVGELGEGFFGPENTPTMLLAREEDPQEQVK